MNEIAPTPNQPEVLVRDLRRLIVDARRQTVAAVNVGLTLLYWRLGDCIRREVLGSERAGYGEQIVATLPHALATEFGRGFERTNLTRMMKFAEAFSDEEIVATLSHQLSWSHFRELLPLERPLQREFYAEMCRMEGWSVLTLRGRIDSMLYERTALSRKPDELAKQELATLKSRGEVGPSLILKDPYILDFLDLKDQYIERDFEDAILRELEMFLLELGFGFSFIARQKLIQLDGRGLLHRSALLQPQAQAAGSGRAETGSFRAEYKGQMELYLRWLTKYESEDAEGPPLGIILCAGAS